MSPVLFNVYTDQLGCNLIYLGLDCKRGCTMANCFFYADDICLLSPSVFGLQAVLDATENYADDHNISFNVSKTVCITFSTGKDSLLPDPKIKLKGCELVWINSLRYLGFTITNCFDNFDEEEMYTRTRELRVRANKLIIIEFIDMALAHSIRVTYTFIYQEKLEIVTERKMHMKKNMVHKVQY